MGGPPPMEGPDPIGPLFMLFIGLPIRPEFIWPNGLPMGGPLFIPWFPIGLMCAMGLVKCLFIGLPPGPPIWAPIPGLPMGGQLFMGLLSGPLFTPPPLLMGLPAMGLPIGGQLFMGGPPMEFIPKGLVFIPELPRGEFMGPEFMGELFMPMGPIGPIPGPPMGPGIFGEPIMPPDPTGPLILGPGPIILLGPGPMGAELSPPMPGLPMGLPIGLIAPIWCGW